MSLNHRDELIRSIINDNVGRFENLETQEEVTTVHRKGVDLTIVIHTHTKSVFRLTVLEFTYSDIYNHVGNYLDETLAGHLDDLHPVNRRNSRLEKYRTTTHVKRSREKSVRGNNIVKKKGFFRRLLNMMYDKE